MSTNELIAGMVAWAVANTGFAAPAQLPIVEFQPTAHFERACRPDTVHCTTRAYYVDGSGTIVLHSSLEHMDDARTRAILMHEIVHYLQDLSGEFGAKTCESWVAREHQANRLQLSYLVAEGANPFSHAMPPLDVAMCEERSQQ